MSKQHIHDYAELVALVRVLQTAKLIAERLGDHFGTLPAVSAALDVAFQAYTQEGDALANGSDRFLPNGE